MPCARHVGVVTRCADGAALFRAEEPVKCGDDGHGEKQQQGQWIVERQRADVALRQKQVVFVYTERLIGLACHDAQVDRVERELRQDAGENGGNAAARVKKAGDESCKHTCQQRAQERHPRIEPRADEHDADGAAGGERAIDGQVCDVQNPVGDVHADGHDAPRKTLCGGTGQRIHQRRKKTHMDTPFTSADAEAEKRSASAGQNYSSMAA